MFLSKLDKNPIKKVTQYISYICIYRFKNCDSLIHAFVWDVCAVNKHVFQVHMNLYM